MTEPDEGIMAKIAKLLERANHPDTPPAEAQLSEEMAERLMAKHMIDRFEAEQAAKRRGESVRKPIQENWIVNMSNYKSENGDYATDAEFDGQILSMVEAVLQHCNIRINPNFSYSSKETGEEFGTTRRVKDPFTRIYQIVGYREDIAYAERIWFNVFRTFVSNINPQWDKEASIGYNSYNFASAGLSWRQVVMVAVKAGDPRIEVPWIFQPQDAEPTKEQPYLAPYPSLVGVLIEKEHAHHANGDPAKFNYPLGRSINKVRGACKEYCAERGLKYPYSTGSKLRVASRNSFARSYRATITDRLAAIRLKAQGDQTVSDRDKFALAVKDTKEQVDAEFYRLFPQYDPEVRRKMREAAEFERAVSWAALSPEEQARVLREEAAGERAWARAASRSRRSYRTVRAAPERYDAAAWDRGRQAAQSVNLRNDGEVAKEKRREIN